MSRQIPTLRVTLGKNLWVELRRWPAKAQVLPYWSCCLCRNQGGRAGPVQTLVFSWTCDAMPTLDTDTSLESWDLWLNGTSFTLPTSEEQRVRAWLEAHADAAAVSTIRAPVETPAARVLEVL